MVEKSAEIDLNIARCLFILFAVSILLNGSVFWLKRVGWIDTQNYAAYYRYQDHLAPDKLRQMTDEQILQIKLAIAKNHNVVLKQLYKTDGWQQLTKLAKDFAFVLFLLVSVWLVIKQNYWDVLWNSAGLAVFAVYIFVLMVLAAWQNGWLFAVIGARTFSFLAVALTGCWAATHAGLGKISQYFFVVLVLQLLLLFPEALYGLNIFTGQPAGPLTFDRMVGTLSQPGTLAAFAVTVCALFLSLRQSQLFILAMAVSGVIVWASVSILGALAWVSLAGLYLLPLIYRRMNTVLSVILLFTAVILVVAGFLSGRDSFLHSALYRLEKYGNYFSSDISLYQWFFGQGIWVGSNTTIAAERLKNPEPLGFLLHTDSTPLLLIAQTGVVGAVLFYGIAWAAFRRDRLLRPVYFILFLTSLGTNITELYPLNFILGMSLAHSFAYKNADKINPTSTNTYSF